MLLYQSSSCHFLTNDSQIFCINSILLCGCFETLMGHAHLGVIAFGSSVSIFSSVHEAIVSQFLWLLGSNIPMHELNDASPIVGRFFFVSFISSITVVLGNTFMPIINENYASSCASKEGTSGVYYQQDCANLVWAKNQRYGCMERKHEPRTL